MPKILSVLLTWVFSKVARYLKSEGEFFGMLELVLGCTQQEKILIKILKKNSGNTKFGQILLNRDVANVYYSRIWIVSLCRGQRSKRRTGDLSMAVALDLQLAAAVGFFCAVLPAAESSR